MISKQVNKQAGSMSLLQQAARGFAGGGKKPKAIDPKCVDYDIVFIGK